jgi:hypothetical protein
MRSTVVWPARRVGDRILCGRKVADRYVCQGELAHIEWPVLLPDMPAVEMITLPGGYTEDPPGSNHWRMTERAVRQRARGRKPQGAKRNVRPAMTSDPNLPPPVQRGFPGPEWTRECPHCACTARITSAVLD